VVVLLRFVALYSFFDAMAIIFGSAVRGAGDTRFAMYVSLTMAWLLLVLPTFLTWQFGPRSLLLCWMYCTVYVIGLGFVFLARFLQGKWQQMNVIHRNEPPHHALPALQAAETLPISS
jgi:MATE family multidrug resistance protein